MKNEADDVAWYVSAMMRFFPCGIFIMATFQAEGHFADMICREHSSSSQYSKLKEEAVAICSLPCQESFDCTVCDAARTTSEASRFFSSHANQIGGTFAFSMKYIKQSLGFWCKRGVFLAKRCLSTKGVCREIKKGRCGIIKGCRSIHSYSVLVMVPVPRFNRQNS